MAPELFVQSNQGQYIQYSAATDVYALGTVFHEIALRAPHASNVPIPQNCPAEFATLIRGCLQIDPTIRIITKTVIEKLRSMLLGAILPAPQQVQQPPPAVQPVLPQQQPYARAETPIPR